MRDWSTFFQTCIYLCILIIILTFSISFINGLKLFTSSESGISTEKESNNVLELVSGFEGGFEYIWLTLLTATGLGALVVAKITQSTNMIGVWLFSGIFWTSYNKCISVVSVNNWIPAEFLLIFTVAILFLWVAAITGMLTGSG